jgi:hypothetical protein
VITKPELEVIWYHLLPLKSEFVFTIIYVVFNLKHITLYCQAYYMRGSNNVRLSSRVIVLAFDSYQVSLKSFICVCERIICAIVLFVLVNPSAKWCGVPAISSRAERWATEPTRTGRMNGIRLKCYKQATRGARQRGSISHAKEFHAVQ